MGSPQLGVSALLHSPCSPGSLWHPCRKSVRRLAVGRAVGAALHSPMAPSLSPVSSRRDSSSVPQRAHAGGQDCQPWPGHVSGEALLPRGLQLGADMMHCQAGWCLLIRARRPGKALPITWSGQPWSLEPGPEAGICEADTGDNRVGIQSRCRGEGVEWRPSVGLGEPEGRFLLTGRRGHEEGREARERGKGPGRQAQPTPWHPTRLATPAGERRVGVSPGPAPCRPRPVQAPPPSWHPTLWASARLATPARATRWACPEAPPPVRPRPARARPNPELRRAGAARPPGHGA